MNTDKLKIEKAVPNEREELAKGLEKWMSKHPTKGTSLVEIIHLMTGENSYGADDEIPNMQAFVLNLLVFFCKPDNAEKFNEIDAGYAVDEWPFYLHRIFIALKQIEQPYPRAEMHHYEASRRDNLYVHQVQKIADDYGISHAA